MKSPGSDSDAAFVSHLHSAGASLQPTDVAESIRVHFGYLSQSLIVFQLKRIYPWIPLRIVHDAGAWNRVSNGGLDDVGFNKLLQEWLEEPPDRG
jgi:hypothetical protein